MTMGKVIPSACITANRTLITNIRAKVHLVILGQTPNNIKPNHHIYQHFNKGESFFKMVSVT